MKKLFLPLLLTILLPLTYSCGSARLGYSLNERDAAAAIRELLELGARDNLTGSFNRDMIITSLFGEKAKNALNALSLLGMTGDIDKLTNTLGTAAERTASASIPIFVSSINNMRLTDAMRIIKGGGTSATDYLRSSTGDQVRTAIRPIVQSTLDEYKLNDQWSKITKQGQSVFGSKFNPDLNAITAALVTEAMFRKIEQKEAQVRADAAARTTPLLQKVFSRVW